MVDLPKNVQWLLDFANLGCKQGEANLQSLDIMLILKRPPVKAPEVSGLLHNLPHSGLNTFTDEQGNEWLSTRGKPVYLGKISYPTPLDFKNFFVKYGEKVVAPDGRCIFFIEIQMDECRETIPFWEGDDGEHFLIESEKRGHSFFYLQSFWVVARRGLSSVMAGDRGFDLKAFNEHVTKNHHCGEGDTMPAALYSHLADWRFEYRKLHPRLKACSLCGTFWISDPYKKGRKQVFCGEICTDYASRVSREKDIEHKLVSKRHKQKKVMKEIVKYLTENHYERNGKGVFGYVTREQAKEIYNEEKQKNPKNVASLDNFKRTCGYKYM